MFLLLKKYQPIVYSPYNLNENLLIWGSQYSSEFNKKIDNEFTIFFQKVAIKVKSYKIMITNKDVYPIKWYLAVSNNNQTWKNISNVDEHFCKKENQESLYTASIKCKINETRTFDTTDHQGYYQFVKFHLIENTYYETSDFWKKLIIIFGFKLYGNIFGQPTNVCKKHLSYAFLFTIFIVL